MLDQTSMPRYLPKFSSQLSALVNQQEPKPRSIAPVAQTVMAGAMR